MVPALAGGLFTNVPPEKPTEDFYDLENILYDRMIGEKQRYTRLNAEFQRIARRDKKAFLSDQCKEIEENNRMGKTRDFFKKIKDTKETFHAKMGSKRTEIVGN